MLVNDHIPTVETVVFVSGYVIIYLFFLIRNTIRDQLDLYDFILLSMVSVMPLAFIYFPHTILFLTRFSGVTFPFVLLFGGLFLITFIMLYRHTVISHKLQKTNWKLIQELALLRLKLDDYEQVGK